MSKQNHACRRPTSTGRRWTSRGFAQTSNGVNFLGLSSNGHKVIILGGFCLALFSLIDKTLAAATLFIIFLSAFALFFINKIKEKDIVKFLSVLFLIVFSIHILAVVFIYYANFQPFSGGRGDFNEYNSIARQISERVSVGNFSLKQFDEFPNLVNYYPVIVGYIYVFTTPSMLLGQLLNAWIVALISVFSCLIVKEIGKSLREGFFVGLIISFYPSLFFYGSLLLKDALVVLLAIISLLVTLKIIKKFSWLNFIIFYLTLVGVTHLRFYLGYALVLNFIVNYLFFSDLKIKKRVIYGIIIIILFGFLPFSSLDGKTQGYMGFNAFKSFISYQTITSYRELAHNPKSPIENQSQSQSQPQPQPQPQSQSQLQTKTPTSKENPIPGYYSPIAQDSSIIIDTGFDSPLSFFKNILQSFTYVVLGPFPWQLTHKKHLFTLLEMIPWYFLLFFIVKGIIKSIKRDYKTIMPFIIFCLFIFGLLSLYINNFGIITRIRIPAFLALLCLLPLGFKKLNYIKIPFFEKYLN